MINPKKILECRANPIGYTDDQKSALLLVQTFLHSKELFFLLSGNAGTGKTTLAENIARYANARMIAPTNAAVQRLKDRFKHNNPNVSQFSESSFSTIHAILYGAPDPDTGEFITKEGLMKGCVYIVDEASMIDYNVLDDLIDEASRKKTKLIFLGDDFQLEPVGKDPKLFSWEQSDFPFDSNWRVKLNEVMRNEGSILEVATHLRNNVGVQVLNKDQADFKLVNQFTSELPLDISHSKDFVVLVPTNRLRLDYNRHIRNAKYEEDAVNPFNDGERLIAVGNNVFMNGETYTIRYPKLICDFDKAFNIGSRDKPTMKRYKMYLISHEVEGKEGEYKTLLVPNLDIASLHSHQILSNYDLRRDNDLTKYHKGVGKRLWRSNINIATYGYAISVHKSQGNEWDNVYVDVSWLSDAWNKARWLYTAITRAKKKVEVRRSHQFQIVDG